MLWWIDPEKEARLEDAKISNAKLPVGDVDIKFWPKWNKKSK